MITIENYFDDYNHIVPIRILANLMSDKQVKRLVDLHLTQPDDLHIQTLELNMEVALEHELYEACEIIKKHIEDYENKK